ncbi:tetratricopeptide repeat protein [Schlesneria sp. T3-172]|uniref:tetratricopeptide repeat protein n=1 Tax=Schlesneria sphaerica TaxID=3373610 RepID=UPI0037C73069
MTAFQPALFDLALLVRMVPLERIMKASIARLLCLATLSLAASATCSVANDLELFRRPALAEQSQEMQLRGMLLARMGHQDEALRLMHEAVKLAPFSGVARYNLACIYAKNGKGDESLAALKESIERGFAQVGIAAKDPDFNSIRDRADFQELMEKYAQKQIEPKTPNPAELEKNIAWVGSDNTIWDEPTNLLKTGFQWKKPVRQPAVILEHGEVGKRLKKWFAEGTAAGNFGDLYDNCDSDHSNLKYAQFPQLHRIEYKPEILSEIQQGFQHRFLHGGVVIGNSSTSLVSTPLWRSNVRMAYTRPTWITALARQYTLNHLYVYPEHTDHDPGHNGSGGGYGDLFPANTPYVLISQGSSYTDQPFLDALACTLAAFRPEVKKKLVDSGFIAPTLQQIFRSNYKALNNEDEYLTGVAHPSVFDGTLIDPLKMIEAAHAMTETTIPPVVRFRIEQQDRGIVGRDYFDAADREHLFDTACAIARVGRSMQFRRRMIVSARESIDLNGHPLKYQWVVLRGDPSLISLKPLDETGSRADITVAWHPRRKIQPDSDIESNRVDIGVFAFNGTHWSPPSFITWYFLDNEDREYDESGRILSVSYHGGTDKGNYADPLIQTPKTWKDEYKYTPNGDLIGWTRTRANIPRSKPEDFTYDGALIIAKDELGRATEAQTVRYLSQSNGKALPTLVQQLGDEILQYQYQDVNDQIGKVVAKKRALPPSDKPTPESPTSAKQE